MTVPEASGPGAQPKIEVSVAAANPKATDKTAVATFTGEREI
jgi:hypothetical protein